MADELTQEEIEQREQMIEQMIEQIRVGKTGIDAQIDLYLKTTRTGKAMVGAKEATDKLTRGFVDSSKAIAGSTGNFGDLSAVVSGTIGAVSGLLGKIPVLGSAFSALGDAAAETADFAFGQVQAGFDSFQDLSKAGQIGAEGITGMAERMRSTNMPLATYTKLLGENSQNLTFFSTAALEGGKTFAETMTEMASGTGKPLRRLGLSVEEIGQTVVDFQVMNRRQGLLNQLSQEQIRKGTQEYAKELDLIARLTGKTREEVQKEREEAMSDSRFRAALADLPQEIQDEHLKAISQIADPTVKRAYMDQLTGFTNTNASIQMEIVGMGDSIRGAQDMINNLGGSGTDAVNGMREAAKQATEAGGMMQQYSKVVESGTGVMGDYAALRDFAITQLKDEKAAAVEQAAAMNNVNSQTDQLVTSMMELQQATSAMNNFFIATPAATFAIDSFATALNKSILFIEDMVIGGGAERTMDSAKDVYEKVTTYTANDLGEDVYEAQQNIAQEGLSDFMFRNVAGLMGHDIESPLEKQKRLKDMNLQGDTMYAQAPLIAPKGPEAPGSDQNPLTVTVKQTPQLAAPKPEAPTSRYTPKEVEIAQKKAAQKDQELNQATKDFYDVNMAAQQDGLSTEEKNHGRAMLAEMSRIRTELQQLNKVARSQEQHTKKVANNTQ